jgi:hypothetical protein
MAVKRTVVVTGKHVFRWPGSWMVKDQPHGCVVISCEFPCRIERRKVLSWFRSQKHIPRTLPCGCTVCTLCSQLLAQDVKSGSWWTVQPDWLITPLLSKPPMLVSTEPPQPRSPHPDALNHHLMVYFFGEFVLFGEVVKLSHRLF